MAFLAGCPYALVQTAYFSGVSRMGETEKTEQSEAVRQKFIAMRKKAIAALEARGAVLPCARCGNPDFVVTEGYSAIPSRGEHAGAVNLGEIIPTITTICVKCGAVYQHAIGILNPELKDLGEPQPPGKEEQP